LQGFDEYMNLVLDEAEEVSMKRKTRKPLGMVLPLLPLAVTSIACFLPTAACPGHPEIQKYSAAAGRILLKGDNITLMQTT